VRIKPLLVGHSVEYLTEYSIDAGNSYLLLHKRTNVLTLELGIIAQLYLTPRYASWKKYRDTR